MSSRTRCTSPGRAKQPPRDHATVFVRGLRCRLCTIDQQQEAAEGRRQHHIRRAVAHIQRADAALAEFDALSLNLDWVRAALRRELAEADQ